MGPAGDRERFEARVREEQAAKIAGSFDESTTVDEELEATDAAFGLIAKARRFLFDWKRRYGS